MLPVVPTASAPVSGPGEEFEGPSYLCSIRSVVNWSLQTSSHSALSISPSQKLPDLARELSDLCFADLWLWGVQGRRVKVEA